MHVDGNKRFVVLSQSYCLHLLIDSRLSLFLFVKVWVVVVAR